MKNFLKSIIAFKLRLISRIVIRRYHPRIVMVTGSVGKTTTKDAVAAVLREKFFVRKSEKSFNSEFGVPFTILGVENPWFNFFAWIKVIKSALALLLLPNHYPNLLVLETGADCPGDLSRILKIATPDMVVTTYLPEISVHVEFYESPEAVREEEFSPAFSLPASAPLVVCADDSYSMNNSVRTSARVISYGISDKAFVNIKNIGFYELEGKITGMQAEIKVGNENNKIFVNGSVGKTQLLPLAAAIAAGQAFGISLKDSIKALESYVPPPGRGRIFSGKNGSVIIDDSYNASPIAVKEALDTLRLFPTKGRKIAILGDMLELGRYSVIEHERIASLADKSADVIISVGIRSRIFASKSKKESLSFYNSKDAAKEISAIAKEGDVILVKGSQSIRMERVVEALLENPSDVENLVRQEKAWKRKP